jgi:hypothetical protein
MSETRGAAIRDRRRCWTGLAIEDVQPTDIPMPPGPTIVAKRRRESRLETSLMLSARPITLVNRVGIWLAGLRNGLVRGGGLGPSGARDR